MRAVVGSSTQLTSFAITKDLLREYDTFVRYPVVTSFVASIIGGIFQCWLMNPFDLISIRLYNQGKLILKLDKNYVTKTIVPQTIF